MENQDQNRRKEIALTILQQLGGVRPIMTMLGVKTFMYDETGVGFRYDTSYKNNSNHIHISLNSNDLYNIVFNRIHEDGCEVVSRFDDVYCDQLKSIFEEETAHYLTMPVIIGL